MPALRLWLASGDEVVTVPGVGLFVAPCSREAAIFAVKAWHYLHVPPSGRCSYWGVWFDGVFDGAVIVSRGASPNIGRPFVLTQDRIAEVTRIALRPGHVAPVSQVLSVVRDLLRKSNPRLELLVSYADSRYGHDGRGVYGGAGWTYLGQTAREALLRVHGRERHARTISSKFGTRDLGWLRAHVDPNAARIDCPPKHKYALALTPAMREQLALLVQPYPTRDRGADSGTRGLPAEVVRRPGLGGRSTREGAAHIRPGRSIVYGAEHV